MNPSKDPIGYPGDEAVRKAFGQTVKRARLELGLTTNQAEILLREALTPVERHDKCEHIGRALGILIRRIRERKCMTRVQLAGSSGLPVRFLILAESGKVTSGGDLCQLVRLAYGLKYPVNQFFLDLTNLNEELASESR